MILGARVSPTNHSQFPRSPEVGVSSADSLVTSVYIRLAFFFDSVEGYPMFDVRVSFVDACSRLLH